VTERRDYVVHIVDDEETVRQSLAFMLTVAGFAVRIHKSATDFLALARSLTNACLITDLRMPDMSGVDLLRRLAGDGIVIPSIVITGHGDVPMAVEAMKAGAVDFIEKPFPDDVLIDAIRHASERLESPAANAGEVASIQRRLNELTERERQVLSGVVAGLANKTIGYDLDISPRTVEVHRANIMAKMQARSLAELVRMALAAGFGPR
jgi:two-component system, LuxR family, response regulator FixJ